jgi:Ca-activated chloride channel family protein
VADAEKASELGIRIYTIGIGNPRGELIPLRGTEGSVDGYKKDESGETVLSRLDETTLRKIASAAGGQYLPATREGLELKVLYREISGLERAAIKGEFLEKKKDKFAWFLAAAFLALFIDLATLSGGSMKRRLGRRILHTGAAAAALLLAALFSSPAAAKGIDKGRVKSGNQYYKAGEYQKSLVLYQEALGDSTKPAENADGVFYNEANAFHMLGRYPEALEKYHESQSDDTTQTGRMLYNRANTLVKMGKLPEAVESYLQSLAYLPDDEDARHNLELALRALDEQKQQQQNQQQDQKNDQQKDQQKEQQKDNQGQNDQQQKNDKGEQQPQQPDSTRMQPQPSPQDSMPARPELPDSVQMMELSKEDALRLLKLLEEQEKELQKERRKAAFIRASRSGKDW